MSSKRAGANNPKLEVSLSPEDRQLFKAAWETARAHHLLPETGVISNVSIAKGSSWNPC